MKSQDGAQVGSILAHRGEFFSVLQQTSRTQCAVMTIAPGADGGPAEEHGGDQIVYVIEGEATLRIDGREHQAGAGTLVTIPAGARHHVRNPGPTPLFFLTVYAPPEYQPDAAESSRDDGAARERTRAAMRRTGDEAGRTPASPEAP